MSGKSDNSGTMWMYSGTPILLPAESMFDITWTYGSQAKNHTADNAEEFLKAMDRVEAGESLEEAVVFPDPPAPALKVTLLGRYTGLVETE